MTTSEGWRSIMRCWCFFNHPFLPPPFPPPSMCPFQQWGQQNWHLNEPWWILRFFFFCQWMLDLTAGDPTNWWTITARQTNYQTIPKKREKKQINPKNNNTKKNWLKQIKNRLSTHTTSAPMELQTCVFIPSYAYICVHYSKVQYGCKTTAKQATTINKICLITT